MNIELVILDGPQAGRRLPVNTTPRTIGRTTNSEVAFPDDNFLSGVHLSVQMDPFGVRITDLRSTNGTFLNGQRVTEAVAEIGDVLQIGTMSMQVTMAPMESAPPTPESVILPVPASPAPGPSTTMFQLPAMHIPAPPVAAPPVTMPPISAPPAGGTTTLPMFSAPTLPPVVVPVTFTPAPRPASDSVAEVLAGISSPVYAMVNVEASDTIVPFLQMGLPNLRQYVVWEGDPLSAPSWAPFLLPVSAQTPWLKTLLERGWGQGFVSFLVSSAPGTDVQKHFAKFLSVQVGSGNGVYFRFYDPHVLRDFLGKGSPAELTMFFGPVQEWLLEGESAGTLMRAFSAPDGTVTSSTASI